MNDNTDWRKLYEQANERIANLQACLRQIIIDLPTNRDWLDPDIERQARELLK